MTSGAFAKLRKATAGFVVLFLSVRPCVEQLGSHWTDFHEILYLGTFRKYTENIRDSLQFHKNTEHFTLAINIHFWPHLAEFFLKWEIFYKNVFWENQNTHWEYVILIAFPLRQWLHESASILHYTYIACLIYNAFCLVSYEVHTCSVFSDKVK